MTTDYQFMTYDEAAQANVEISRKRAAFEIARHGADLEEFFKDLGWKDVYTTREVLLWLGY